MAILHDRPAPRIGVIGTGFIARHFLHELLRRSSYSASKVLTRRDVNHCSDFPCAELLVNDLDALIESSDLVLECTGDAHYAAETIGEILDAGLPVVTLNSEFQATVGSYFVGRGILSEADGDQPGCLAALHEDAVAMGFTPLVCANMKAFLNLDPVPEEMAYWARKQNYSVEMVTSFTDGTKLQMEQCLVANGLGLDIARRGMTGLREPDLAAAGKELGRIAEAHGSPISDFILDRSVRHGVFIVARHDEQQKMALRNYKLGDGPYYVLLKDYCLCHLEVFKTIERLLQTRRPLLNNTSSPRISVASVVKRDLRPGDAIARGVGSFELRGECVRIEDEPDHVPICLANELRICRSVERGQVLSWQDVELPETQALHAWQAIRTKQRRELTKFSPAESSVVG